MLQSKVTNDYLIWNCSWVWTRQCDFCCICL